MIFFFGQMPPAADTCPVCHKGYDDHDLRGPFPICPPQNEIEFFPW